MNAQKALCLDDLRKKLDMAKKKTNNKSKPLSSQELSKLSYKPSIAQRYTPEEVAKAIEQSHGITWRILHLLDCTYMQWAVYTSQHREAAEQAKQARGEFVAEAEKTLDYCLKNGSEKTKMEAAKYILSKLGRDEGWGEDQPKVAVEVNDSEKQVQIRAIFGLGSSKEENNS